jgi:Arc/MetJ family transcription regulator
MMPILMLTELPMRTTINLDDDLVRDARELTGLKETTAIVRAGLTALVEREAARRLARLGGTAPDFVAGRRRRPE